MSAVSTISLLRHGITAANIGKRFAGRTDEPLHPDGEAAIRTLAGELAKGRHGLPPVTAVICGPLTRTRQTAAIIAERLALPIFEEPRLTEIDIAHWDGLTKDEIRARFGDQYPTWLAAPDRFYVPGCETIADVQRRAVAAIEDLFAGHQGGHALVVSHLIPIRAVLLHYLGLPIARFRSIEVPNGALRTLQRQEDGKTTLLA